MCAKTHSMDTSVEALFAAPAFASVFAKTHRHERAHDGGIRFDDRLLRGGGGGIVLFELDFAGL